MTAKGGGLKGGTNGAVEEEEAPAGSEVKEMQCVPAWKACAWGLWSRTRRPWYYRMLNMSERWRRGVARAVGLGVQIADWSCPKMECLTSRDLASVSECSGVVDVVTLSDLGFPWVRNGVLGEREDERWAAGVWGS